MNSMFLVLVLLVASCSGDGGDTVVNNPPPTIVAVPGEPGSCVEVGSAKVENGSFVIIAACVDGQGNSTPFCFADDTQEIVNCPTATTQATTIPPPAT